MALRSTQALVKMSTRNIPGGKCGGRVRLTTSPPSCAECHEIWNPLGHTGPVKGLLYVTRCRWDIRKPLQIKSCKIKTVPFGGLVGRTAGQEVSGVEKKIKTFSWRDTNPRSHTHNPSTQYHILKQYLVEKYRQVANTQQNYIRCRDATIIDYMFRPFFIRPSSGLAWRNKG